MDPEPKPVKKRTWPIYVIVYVGLIIVAVIFFQLYAEQQAMVKEMHCQDYWTNITTGTLENNGTRICNAWDSFKLDDCKTEVETVSGMNAYCALVEYSKVRA